MQFPIFSFSFLLLFIIIFLASIIFLFLSSLRKTKPTYKKPGSTHNPEISDPINLLPSDAQFLRPGDEPTPNPVSDMGSSGSVKWVAFMDNYPKLHDPNTVLESGQGEVKKKKKRKVNKKKKMDCGNEEDEKKEAEKGNSDSGTRKPGFDRLDPFTSSSSVMQKKIKPQYDELVKCNDSKKLTLSQVVQFANSLVDARSGLQHKADAIQRKFVITKALLCKADRSSVDRLQQQIYKLELEQKRLEEDAFVYNWLQQQLKLSPAYNKMLEIGVSMEKEKCHKLGERSDDEFSDISFEELLAQEKKDTFWQRNGRLRQCSS